MIPLGAPSFESFWSQAAAAELSSVFPYDIPRPRQHAPTAPGITKWTNGAAFEPSAPGNLTLNPYDQGRGHAASPESLAQSRQRDQKQRAQNSNPSSLSLQPPQNPAWGIALDPPLQLVVPNVIAENETKWAPDTITLQSQYILVDSQRLLSMCYPNSRNRFSPERFWPQVKQIDVHISTAGSRPLNWRRGPDIQDQNLRENFFGRNQAVALSLRNLDLVDRVWDAVNASSDPEAERIKTDIERAVAAVTGPSGCRRFPYPDDMDLSWLGIRQQFEQTYLYEESLRNPPGIPFPNLLEADPVQGGLRPNLQIDWVRQRIEVMPRLREVLFFTNGMSPEFETPAFGRNDV